MSVLTAFDVAAMFAVKGGEMVLAVHEGLEKAAKVVETRAKDIIGHYQQESGPFEEWRELADSTKADRVKQGYSENEPLLRSGDMRESIEHSADGSKAVVGSDDDKALWMEMGTHGPHPGADGYHVPPRSFLGAAAFQEQDKVAEIIGDAVFAMLVTGKSGVKF